jgi:hypothetical protein
MKVHFPVALMVPVILASAKQNFRAVMFGQSQAGQRVLGTNNDGSVSPGKDGWIETVRDYFPDAAADLINGATGGSGLTQKGNNSSYWWGDDGQPGPCLLAGYQAILTAGYAYEDIDFVFWDQGDNDANVTGRYVNAESVPGGQTKAELLAAMQALFTHIAVTLPNAVIYIDPIGRRNPADSNRSYTYVRECELACIGMLGGRVRLGAENSDKALRDGLHLTNPSIENMGIEDALTVLSDLGSIAPAGTMRLISAVLDGDEITVDFSLAGGTDFSPATGIKGFHPRVNGYAVSVISVVQATPVVSGQGRVVITLSSAPTGSDRVTLHHYHDQGADWAAATPNNVPVDIIRNNAGHPVGLQSFFEVLQDGEMPVPILKGNFINDKTLAGLSLTAGRVTAGLTIGADGYFQNVAANNVRWLYTAAFPTMLGMDGLTGMLVEEALKAKNLYARPSSGTFANHFVVSPTGMGSVSDTANPAKNLGGGGTVWSYQNLTGGPVDIEWAGAASVATRHSIQLCYKIMAGDPCQLSLEGKGAITLDYDDWAHAGAANIVAAIGDNLRLTVPHGTTIRFTLANLVETYGSVQDCVNMPIDCTGTALTTNGDDNYLTSAAISSVEGTVIVEQIFLSAGKAGAVACAVRSSANRTGMGYFLLLDLLSSVAGMSIHRRLNSTTPNWSNNLVKLGTVFPKTNKFGLRWKDGDSQVCFEGLPVAANTGAAAVMPTGLNELAFHRQGVTTDRGTYVVTRFEVYDKALSNRRIMEHEWVAA